MPRPDIAPRPDGSGRASGQAFLPGQSGLESGPSMPYSPMVRFVIVRRRKLFSVERVAADGSTKLVGQFADEQEAISLRGSLQKRVDAEEVRSAVLSPVPPRWR